MFKVSAKGMWAHKRRLFGTVFAVVLGVAFLAGTLVLGDTMRAGIDTAFTEANAGIDGVVRSDTKVGTDDTETRGLIDASLAGDGREGRRRRGGRTDRGREGSDRRRATVTRSAATVRRPMPATGSRTRRSTRAT